MEKFIPEVGPASEIEPKETKSSIVELASALVEASKLVDFDEEDEESDWIWFGVGGPA
jgi:hypothetical protein